MLNMLSLQGYERLINAITQRRFCLFTRGKGFNLNTCFNFLIMCTALTNHCKVTPQLAVPQNMTLIFLMMPLHCAKNAARIRLFRDPYFP